MQMLSVGKMNALFCNINWSQLSHVLAIENREIAFQKEILTGDLEHNNSYKVLRNIENLRSGLTHD